MARFCSVVTLVAGLSISLSVTRAVAAAGVDSESNARIRDAAARAVALIQASQTTWQSRAGCSSCHHSFQPAPAARAALEHGVRVNEPASFHG